MRTAAPVIGPATRLALVDDDSLLAEGLPLLLESYDDLDLVAVTKDWRDLLEWSEFLDVVLMDLHLLDGYPLRHKVKRLASVGCAVLVLADRRREVRAEEVLESGARGYAHKQDGQQALVTAIRCIAGGEAFLDELHHSARRQASGRPRLSVQETCALRLFASGRTIPEVAEEMAVTPHTATSYIRRVRDKYAALGRDARSKLDLMHRATEDGLLARPHPSEITRGRPKPLPSRVA